MAESDWEDVPNDNESDWVDAEEAQSSEMPVGEGLTRSALKALPAVGGTIGGLVGSPVAPPFGAIGGATLGGMAGKSVQSGIEGLLFEDERAKHNYDQIVNDQMTGAMEGVTGEMGGQIISKGLSKIPTVYEALKKGAGKMAENATGATAVQASKFRPGSGRQLLDRGLVQFGDDAEKIAERTLSAKQQAEKILDDSLRTLDQKGAVVDLNNVVNHLDKKIAVLEKNASQSKVVEQLKSIRDDIIHSVDVTETGSPEIPVSLAEQTKRGFNQQSKLNWSNPNQGQAQKEAYRSYKGEVETAAETVDPTIANQFKEAKDTYGLLKPIQEAAERRAIQQNQNPIGGFNDMTTAGAGAIAGGPVTAIAAPLARRALAPRIPSMTAVGMDKLANLMERIPSLKNIIEKSPATGQAIMSRLAPEGEDLRTLVPPPPPLSPLQIKSDANLSPSQKGAAMNEINRQKKMMGQ